MYWIDFFIVIVIIFSSLISWFRGFIREALSLITWIGASFVTNYYYSYVSVFFVRLFEEQIICNAIAIILLFVTALIVGTMISYIILSLMTWVGFSLSSTDRVVGFCFGALRGVLIISILLFFLDTFTNFSYYIQDWQQSWLIPRFNGIIRWMSRYLQNLINFLEESNCSHSLTYISPTLD